MIMQLNDHQRLAADPRYSTWLTANAGSGKTAVLVERVLRLLLLGARPGSVLCLTYTVTAANEMLARVQHRMAQWLNGDDAALNDVLEALELKPNAALRQRARQLFLIVAEDPEGLQIRTMHSFCQSLLSRFPFEAGIVPGSRPLEDEMAMVLSREILEAMQTEALFDSAHPLHGDWEYLLTYHPGRMAFADFKAFHDLLDRQDMTIDGLDLSANIQTMADDMGFAGHITEQDWSSICSSLMTPIAWDDLASALQGQALGKIDQDTLDMILACLALEDPVAQAEQMLARCRTNSGGMRKKLLTNTWLEIVPLANSIKQISQAAEQLLWYQSMHKILLFNQHFWPIMQEFCQRYRHLKHRRGWVDYNDQLVLVRRMLEQDGGVSWVRYKLDSRIRYLFVDEAQDTSPVQWQILRRLAEDFFADDPQAAAGEAAPQSLFVVGDPKQSIYRFQGADPEGFQREQQYYTAHSQRRLQSRQLLRCYRSAPAILRVVDATFAGVDARPPLEETFANTRHAAREDALPGYVELAPYVVKEATGFAEHLATRIAGWVGQRPLTGTNRLVEESDIMILMPRRGRLFQQLHHALLRRGIATISGERSRLSASLPVQDILAVLRWLLAVDDDYMLACALKSSLIGLDEQTLYRLAVSRLEGHAGGRSGKRRALFVAMRDQAEQQPDGAVARAWDWLELLYRRLDFHDVNSLLADILYRPCPRGETGLQAILGRFGAAAQRALQRLETQAVAFDQHSFSGVQGFVDAVTYRIIQDNDRVEGSDAVRLMTIHSAKGLEAPIVILPGTDITPAAEETRHIYRSPNAIMASLSVGHVREPLEKLWQDRRAANEAEYWRLGYVAMTRAEQELYIYTDRHEPQKAPQKISLYHRVRQTMQELPGVETLDSDGPFDDETLFASSKYWVCRDRLPSGEAVQHHAKIVPETPRAMATDWLLPTIRQLDTPVEIMMASAAESPAASSFAQRRGTALHGVIEGLCGLSLATAQRRLPILVQRQCGDDEELDRDDIAHAITRLLETPQIQEFVSLARAEVEVIEDIPGEHNKRGRHRVHRLDAVAQRGEDWQIVDFKSAAELPTAVPKGYQQQLQRYKDLWSRLYPRATIRTAIIWIDQAVWQDVS